MVYLGALLGLQYEMTDRKVVVVWRGCFIFSSRVRSKVVEVVSLLI